MSDQTKRRSLSHDQYFKLCQYIKRTSDNNRIHMSEEQLAGVAENALGFEIAPSSVTEACATVNVLINGKNNPPVSEMTSMQAQLAKVSKQMNWLNYAVNKIADELGVKI